MNLLGSVLYDPAVSVAKGAAASVMAAFDTTNARIAFVVPPSGMVRVVIQCTIHGAVTFSQIMLGCLEGSTLRGRVTPIGSLNGTALATTMMTQNVDYIVSGLTPGASVNWDAAWGVETFVASSQIKYGGANDTTANNAFGALVFQIWDPAPNYTPTSGTAPTSTVHVKLDAIDDFVDTEVGAIKTKTDFLPSATAGAAGGLFIAGANAATSITTALTANIIGNVTGNLSGSVGSVTGAVGSVTAAVLLPTIPNNWITAAGINADAITDAKVASDVTIASVTGAVGSVTGAVGSVTGAVGSVTAAVTLSGDFTATMKTSIGTAVAASAVASVTGNVGGNVNGSVASVTAAVSVTGDLSATMKTSVTTAATAATPVAASVTGNVGGNVGGNVVGSVGSVTGLTASNLDATVSSRLASASYTAPLSAAGTRTAVGLASANLDTQLTGIDGKTTNLPSDPADESLIIAATDAIMARLGAPAGASVSADVAAVKSDTGAVKTQTDKLVFTVANKLDVNLLMVNGITVNGNGQPGSEWGP